MNVFDIIGPVIIGPSSSHTAAVVKLGNVARVLLSEEVENAKITLYGSFAKTGKGHGTDKAILAGICGYQMDDERIKSIFDDAKIKYQFEFAENDEYHPNTAVIELCGKKQKVTMRGASIGAGRIEVQEIDDMAVSFNGDFNTLILFHYDECGVLANITGWLSKNNINIAFMRVFRLDKGENVVTVIETDQKIKDYDQLNKIQEDCRVVYYEKSNV